MMAELIIPERLRLKGSDSAPGKYRSPGKLCQIDALDDATAMASYLQSLRDLGRSELTVESSRKEIQRFLIWCDSLGIGISDISKTRFHQYGAFLINPEPAEIWIGPPVPLRRKDGSPNPDWRPFVGPLKPSSRKTAMAYLKAMFTWLHEVGYLAINPGAKTVYKKPPPQHLNKALSFAELECLKTFLNKGLPTETPEQKEAAARAIWIFIVMYYTAARKAEIISSSSAKIVLVEEVEGERTWCLTVTGKGGKDRVLTLEAEFMEGLARYRAAIGFNPLPSSQEALPIICQLGSKKALGGKGLYQEVKRLCQLAADYYIDSDPRLAERFRQVTPHWFRHTSATHMLTNGAPLAAVQLLLGHTDSATTAIYTHSSIDILKKATGVLNKHTKDPSQ